ncbi:hypothetical protein TGAMA5MH_10096 [Trichoderma gamsii]|uniref:Uncharacterized protein n=1 Tax=Trichoderma gamsii TaxID=398673 RepID=A0A2K0SXJ5_9HYPO|nr:hypothetical protein TGAMA5MH_10096 [Trichoderma gamsii]
MRSGLEMLGLLIDHGADINGPSNAAGCVLSSAASHRKTTDLEFLLAKGANINMRGTGENGETALHVAARNGSWHNFDILLQRGADINIGGKYGTALHGLARSDDVAGAVVRMKRLVEMGADPKAQCKELGTALHVACRKREPESIQIVQFLVDSGVDVNIVAGRYGTPLQAMCAWNENIEMAELLLANNADVNLQGGEYGNALQAACSRGNMELAQLLLAHGADVNAQGGYFGNALQAACDCDWRPSMAIVRLLLESGADVNAVGGIYETALQAAAYKYQGSEYTDSKGTVRLLLEYGANVHIQGGKYGNALNAAAAAAFHNLDVLQLLLDHGADVNKVSGERGTPLHNALDTQRKRRLGRRIKLTELCIGKIRFLLENGADVNLPGGEYGLPLQSACVMGSFSSKISYYVERIDAAAKTIRLLLDYEPLTDVNAHGGIFGTALQAAAYSGLAESISLLLERGAQVACHEWCGKYGSALNAAVIKGHWDIVHLLCEAGAKPDCYSMQTPDEEWLLKVRQEDGRGAEERYRKFWELEKPIQEQTLLQRQSLLTAIHFSRLLMPFQLFISFLLAYFIRTNKRE